MTKQIVYQNVHGTEEFCIQFTETKVDPSRKPIKPINERRNIPVLAATVQKTKQWIGDVMEELEWDNAQKCYHGIRAVLHTLRDHLSVYEAVEFAAQLPMLLRGMFYEGWQPARVPIKDRTRETFLASIQSAFPNDPNVDAEVLTIAVMNTVRRHIGEGEMGDIEANLPKHIRGLIATRSRDSESCSPIQI